ncbi:Nickel transporter NicT [Microbacterium timonense]|uniref:HoxN/HupN/NixA family nickel/cobalt transporter n=1 Tax=Microbacterium timonense TaxID=2086576 RepID=UPI000D0E4322|nr:HoxN/HupN/NixA family nickel/cobalt transporter [Microbacterium timonense]
MTAPATTLVRPRPAASERRRTTLSFAGVGAAIVILHVVGFSLLLTTPVPSATGTTLGVGVGLTAYTLGLRHAFDADHIAAIDNTTRKLLEDGGKPITVGFWFSLGHSTVVLGLTVLLALGLSAVAGPLQDESSTLHQVTGVVGTTVSGLFLYIIAGINIALLVATTRTYKRVRSGELSMGQVESDAIARGPLSRVFGGLMRAIRAPWQMYPLGVLFGLGFDTATEIGLLVLAASSVASGLPWYSLLALPVLFAAGMSLLDTADGVVMRFAYGWAFAQPVRRLAYNLTVTLVSVVVALVVGTTELLALLAERLHLSGGLWTFLSDIDLNAVGFGVVGGLIAAWLAALVVWRVRRTATGALPARSRG